MENKNAKKIYFFFAIAERRICGMSSPLPLPNTYPQAPDARSCPSNPTPIPGVLPDCR